MVQQTSQFNADHVLDVKNQLCPLPVIKASEVIQALASGQVLHILATDPGSKADIPAWAEALGHKLLKQEAANGVFEYWVQKG
ncbi:MAG: sulfurtransferase TusA family protein [Chloroflexi bacterium]|nr:sulfurtransferase TusA family protein [Chloroflexota bacterium]